MSGKPAHERLLQMNDWLKKLQNWASPPPIPSAAAVGAVVEGAASGLADVPGNRFYAIGDLHGCLGLLDKMQAAILQDLADKPLVHQAARAWLVYVGDYCDRGPDSAGVLSRLLAPPAGLPPATMLKGNHEDILLAFVYDPEVLVAWRRLGGLQTLDSYGVDRRLAEQGRDLTEARDALMARMPPAHLELLQGLPISWRHGPWFFCHAGVRPGVLLESQGERDLLWIRHEFLDSTADHGARVVHGHTPAEYVEVRPNRINVDTGAYATGRLSCAVLEGDAVRVLMVR